MRRTLALITSILIVCLIVYGSLRPRSSYSFNSVRLTTAPIAIEEQQDAEIKATEFSPFKDYELTFSKRNLFEAPWESESQQKPSKPLAAPDINKQIHLKGIFFDGDPKAIIELLNQRQTVFVSEGEKVDQITVQKIHKDKVVVLFHDQQLELVP